MRLDWSERQAAVARLALSQLSYCTDTGAERGAIADMLADLRESARQDVADVNGGTMNPSPQYRYEHYDPRQD